MYKSSLPAPPLLGYVSHFWEGELHLQSGQEHVHQAIANSKIEWLFCYAGNYANGGVNMPRAGCFGPSGLYRQYVSQSSRYGFFGIRLYPHALPVLFNIPAAAITDQQLDITTLLGSDGAELADQLFNAPAFEDRVAIATSFLTLRVQNKRERFAQFEKLVRTAYHTANHSSVRELTQQANLSPRQFERHFKDMTGFSAKAFIKLTRFEQLILRLCDAGHRPQQSLTAIAHDLGYYDQAHLNRHFREFTGTSPMAYIKTSFPYNLPETD
ncbi:helix-turn-helix domain-containing protein [Chitinophaga lutea]